MTITATKIPLRPGQPIGQRTDKLAASWATTAYLLFDQQAACWYVVLNSKVLSVHNNETAGKTAHKKLVTALNAQLQTVIQSLIKT
jgi:hypothetical protein